MHYGADVPSSISYPSQVREWQPDGSERQFAVKRIIVDRNDSEHVEITQREIGTMRSLPPHPNIVELIGICKRQSGSSRTSVEEVFLLLELCKSGSLAEILMQRAEQKAPLTPSEAAKALYDMALALCHMHAQTPPLAHRDVKPENYILGDTDGRLRLCDFGSATPRVFAHEPSTKSHEVAREEEEIHRTSTPQYRAPEMCDLRRGEPVGVAADVWALGVSLYKLLFLQDLFGTPGEERLGILNFDPSKRLSPAALSSLGATPGTAGANELLLELLRMCLTPSTTARPPVASVLQWLSSRSSRIDGGLGACREELSQGKHTAGMLSLSQFSATGLFPKGHASSGDGVKPYLLVTCGGIRMLSEVAAKGQCAAWTNKVIQLPTHGLQMVEVSVWAHHKRTAHDFLGSVLLELSHVIADPTRATSEEAAGRAYPLQRRSKRSRVSGSLSFAIEWIPYTASSATAAAASVVFVSPVRHQSAPRPPPAASHAAGHSEGAFWATDGIEELIQFDDGVDAKSPSAEQATLPNQPMPTTSTSTGAGTFWSSEAAAAAARQQQQTLPAGAVSAAFAASPSFDALMPSSAADAPGLSAVGSTPSLPAALAWEPGGAVFESVSTLAAPWDRAPSAPCDDSASAMSDAAGSFWATFDASPNEPSMSSSSTPNIVAAMDDARGSHNWATFD